MSTIQPNANIIQNDQEAINAAYQLADFALEQRNLRDQQRVDRKSVV